MDLWQVMSCLQSGHWVVSFFFHTTGVYFPQLWKLEVQDEGVSKVDFTLRPLLFAFRQPPSGSVLTYHLPYVSVNSDGLYLLVPEIS